MCLGLDLKASYIADKEQIQEKRSKKALEDAFKQWNDDTYHHYSKLARYYSENIKRYSPQSEDEDFQTYFVEAVHQLPRIEAILDTLLKGSLEERSELYYIMKGSDRNK